MKYRFLRWPDFKTKAVTFSYDDGIQSDLQLMDIFEKYGFRGTFNVPGTAFAEEGGYRLNKQQAIDRIYPRGHEVAIHGANHMSSEITEPKDWIRDVLDSRSFLEGFYGKIIRGMAYPDRSVDSPEIKSILKTLGITFARLGQLSHNFQIPASDSEWLGWKMTTRNRDPQMLELADKFLQADPTVEYISHRESLLFSCWGHSFEFPPDKWELVDRLGEKIGNRDDIYYATNSEIYDYVHAYNSLVFSCDNTFVYNPTHFTIYMEIDKVNYKIEPNETITIG